MLPGLLRISLVRVPLMRSTIRPVAPVAPVALRSRRLMSTEPSVFEPYILPAIIVTTLYFSITALVGSALYVGNVYYYELQCIKVSVSRLEERMTEVDKKIAMVAEIDAKIDAKIAGFEKAAKP
jgi:hypothetical protein